MQSGMPSAALCMSATLTEDFEDTVLLEVEDLNEQWFNLARI